MRSSSQPRAGEPAREPHPVLPEYYASREAKRGFVGRIFDAAAPDYDRVDRLLALGSGSWYRRQALARAGLAPGMRMLDVAVGTGLVAREAVRILGDARSVVGVDPSAGMMAAATVHGTALVQGRAERLPFADAAFDFLSLGYALRHLSDLAVTFREFRRVLRPGGRLLLLEITPPEGRLARAALKGYMRAVVPWLSRAVARHPETPLLYRYYWDTIEACAPPGQVLAAITAAGFAGADRFVQLGIFSEFRARA